MNANRREILKYTASHINLTSFDEDPRPPFRYITAGVAPTHAAMIHKPLYHGCIDAHGAVPSSDGRLLATSGRGSSNVYLIDAVEKRVIGNTPNPVAGPATNPERLSSGILLDASRMSRRSAATARNCGSRCAAKTALPFWMSTARCVSCGAPKFRRCASSCPR